MGIMMIAGTELRRQGCSLQDGKQWGFTVFDPAYYKNVNFTLPLSVNGTFCAFSTGYDAKGSTFLWHSMSHFNNVNVGVTGFVFDSRYTFTGLGYLAVCWQKQWGFNSAGNNGSEGESGWYAFPVNFNSACFALFCGLRNTDTNNPTKYDSEVQPRNWTTSKFNVYKQNYGGNPWFGSFIWFAIGRQPASYKL